MLELFDMVLKLSVKENGFELQPYFKRTGRFERSPRTQVSAVQPMFGM